jgi:hypothetical protein
MRRPPHAIKNGSVSLLVADQIARAVLRNSSTWAVARNVVTIGAISFEPLLIILPLPIALVPISSVFRARRVLRVLDGTDATAELKSPHLIARSAIGRARIAPSPSQIARAQAQPIPSAALQRDV